MTGARRRGGAARRFHAIVVLVALALCTGCVGADAPTPTASPPGASPTAVTPGPHGSGPREGAPTGGDARLVAGASDDGRHLVDGQGQPLLLRAETVWAVMQALTLQEATAHLELRAAQGFNAILMSPYPWIGREDDPGQTPDGLRPFDGAVATLDEAYWSRLDAVLEVARSLGITVFLAPSGRAAEFAGNGYDYDEDIAGDLGAALGARYGGTPGIVWLMGVDYDPDRWDADDPTVLAFVDGLRRGGDTHLVTIQLFNTSTSSDSPRWRSVAQIEAVYTYRPTYAAVLDAYARNTGPVILIEANFEGENNEGGPLTTDETLRRQACWTVTSGGVGVTYGERHLWKFTPGWQDARETTAVDELGVVFDVVGGIRWWELVPDADGSFLLDGRGGDTTTGTQEGGFADVLESDRATAAITADGTLAVVYVPTARTIAVDASRLAPGAQAAWVDPTTGATVPADPAAPMTTPGTNAGGDEDWLLLIES